MQKATMNPLIHGKKTTSHQSTSAMQDAEVVSNDVYSKKNAIG